MSTDLYERAPVYHRAGWLDEVVMASLSVPVFFPPRRVDGRVLADGSLSDNCPAAPLCEPSEGPVVAVRIAGPRPTRSERIPGRGETLWRVMSMGDRDSATVSHPPTVLVVPDTRGIGMLELHQIDRAREAGRRAGEAAVAALLQGGVLSGAALSAGDVEVDAAPA